MPFRLHNNPSLVRHWLVAFLLVGIITANRKAIGGTMLVTSRGNLTANDFVDWGVLGEAGSQGISIFTPFVLDSPKGVKINGSLPSGNFLRVDQDQPGFLFTGGWNGNFTPGDHLLAALSGPITLQFLTKQVAAVGAQINGGFGPFQADIEAFDRLGKSLGQFSRRGNATEAGDNSAIFIGIQSDATNIASVRISAHTESLDSLYSEEIAINGLSLFAATDDTSAAGSGGGSGGGGNGGGSEVKFNGTCSWQVFGIQIEIDAERVENRGTLGSTSGTLRLQVWATSSPYSGGTIHGYVLGTRILGQLSAGKAYTGISGMVPFTAPSAGTYYTTMTLEEYTSSGYVIRDYVNFPGTSQFGGGAPGRYRLSMTANPNAGGAVQVSPLPGPDGLYSSGTSVTLTAQPSNGYQFASWSGDLVGQQNPVKLVVQHNLSVTANFTAIVQPASAPTFTPPPGSYNGSVTVNASSATAGATVRYTINGSDPTSSSAIFPWNGLNITSTTTLKARAFKTGMSASSVTSGSYSIVQVPPPAITKQPQSQTVNAGVTVTFTVSATGIGTLSHQWQRKASSSTTWSSLSNGGSFSGATTTTLNIASVTAAMTGDQFRCLISNSAGPVTSSVATLTVNAVAGLTPLLSSKVVLDSSGAVQIRFTASGGTATQFKLQYAENLTAPVVWKDEPAATIQSIGVGAYQVAVPRSTSRMRLFRIKR